MKVLTDFVSRFKEIAKFDENLMFMCQSGVRSAKAVNKLAKSGFTLVYIIYDEMEGYTVNENKSMLKGLAMVNCWKNSGCPWTYILTPENLLLPKDQ